jgi:hypothetical protein
MTAIFKHIDSVIRIIEENDTNETRGAEVAREIQNSLACYRELYRERKIAARQLSRDCFIKKLKIISLSSQGLQESRRVMIQTHQTQSIHLSELLMYLGVYDIVRVLIKCIH